MRLKRPIPEILDYGYEPDKQDDLLAEIEREIIRSQRREMIYNHLTFWSLIAAGLGLIYYLVFV